MPTVEEVGGRFRVRIYVRGEGKRRLKDPDDPTGRRLAYFDTYEDAYVAGVEAERTAAHRGQRIEEYALAWLAHYPRRKHSTRRKYEADVRWLTDEHPRVMGKDFARLPLEEVDRPLARAFARQYPHRKNTLSAMFTDAMHDGVVKVNPFHGLALPAPRGRKDILPLTEEEVELLGNCALAVHEDEHVRWTWLGLIKFLAYVGCRPGEAFALRHENLDYQNEEVLIERALVNGVEDTPKNGRARLVVFPIHAHDAVACASWKSNSDRVFTAPRGGTFNKSQSFRYWDPIRREFERRLSPQRREQLRRARGDKPLALYELRHFCATYLLDKGMAPEDVAYQLGHTDGGRLVVSTYGHPNEQLILDRLKGAYA